MSNDYFNIRFGSKHWQWRRDSPRFTITHNHYWDKNKPSHWLEIYVAFGIHL